MVIVLRDGIVSLPITMAISSQESIDQLNIAQLKSSSREEIIPPDSEMLFEEYIPKYLAVTKSDTTPGIKQEAQQQNTQPPNFASPPLFK